MVISFGSNDAKTSSRQHGPEPAVHGFALNWRARRTTWRRWRSVEYEEAYLRPTKVNDARMCRYLEF
jgi:hypothetical protein